MALDRISNAAYSVSIDGGAANKRRTKSFLRLLVGVAGRLVCRDEEASFGFGAAWLLVTRRFAV
jgi:hypothetical protein